jgi:hypothetical protein
MIMQKRQLIWKTYHANVFDGKSYFYIKMVLLKVKMGSGNREMFIRCSLDGTTRRSFNRLYVPQKFINDNPEMPKE